METKCDKEIDVLVRARYPLIYLVSWEETRIIERLRDMAERRQKKLFLWSITRGIFKLEDVSSKVDEATRDPINALSYIEKYPDPALFVFLDFHSFLNDQTIIRKARDLVSNLKDTYETLIIISPVLTVPVELEKEFVVVDYDMPYYEEMTELLDEIIQVVSKTPEVTIDLTPDTKERLAKAALGLTRSEAENAFARAIVIDKKLDVNDIDKILDEKKQAIRKSKLLEYYELREEFSNVGGVDCLKDWLSKRGIAFTQKAQEFGLPQPKGIMLLGVQGCGKSLTAKAVSGLWKLPLLRLDIGAVFSGIVGSSEENMRRAIKLAEALAPIVLWIDEIEKGLSGVQSSTFSDAGTSARVFSTFLTWLQEKTAAVFVIATANNIQQLPPELLRKGRFDEIFFVDLPTQDERKEIFGIHIKKRKRDAARFDVELLAKESEGFSGAEIEQAVIAAMYDAFLEKKDIDSEGIIRSIKQSVPLSVTMKENIEDLRAWAKYRARPASSSRKEVSSNKERKLEF
ncbi:MAG: ATPase [Omnitrophica WOR_2 bacterium GWF2_43_52]|nr:MAG: ATPase [Omnitrophica WOR_2 bacterium GWC2_44_8]OGX20159.1 MAG: ATPase [Omnitrophica WOR_2 bacterium GWF2_43_52]HAH19284.1 ATPase [Candidatus Omnitrophota bacterium]HBG63693.1 ATPase [Candidatus Omnitrophota bacterium]HCD38128.1 ATPase [Candidatus Omnitrophota bacterium]